MSRTLIISDSLYMRLISTARKRGLKNIADLLEEWQDKEDKFALRPKVVHQIEDLRKQISDGYGEMADSVEFVRNDRHR